MKRLRQKNINTPEHFDKEFEVRKHHKFELERQKFFYDKVAFGDRILDVGAGVLGFGELTAKEKKPADIFAIDFSTNAKKIVQEKYPKINYVTGDVTDLPFKDNFFDVVGSGEVIEHVEEPQKHVDEMCRVCKIGGIILLTTVDTNSENAKKVEYPEHIWEFTAYELTKMFSLWGEVEYNLLGDYHSIKCHKKHNL